MTGRRDRDGPLVDAVNKLRKRGLSRPKLVDRIWERYYPNEPRRRVKSIVGGAISRIPTREETPHTTQPETATQSPAGPARRLAVDDIAVLSDREFARLLRLALGQFGGTVTIETDRVREGVTTVEWSRRGDQVLAVALTRPPGSGLSEQQVTALGELLSAETDSNTRTALVTNLQVAEESARLAAEQELVVCDRQHLDGILALARLPPDAYGEALESGENATFDWDDLLENLSPPPRALDDVDPFDAAEVGNRTALRVLERDEKTADDEEPSETTPGDSGDDGDGTDWIPSSDRDTVVVDEDRMGELHAEGAPDDDSLSKLVDNLER